MVTDFGEGIAALVAMPKSAAKEPINSNINTKRVAPTLKIGFPLNNLFLYL